MGVFLQFGAGNIGRGFLGPLFFEAGFEVVFVEAREDLVYLLNTRKYYPLRVLDAYAKSVTEYSIGPVRALSSSSVEDVAVAFAQAEACGTAVGVRNLVSIAPLIALGIRRRYLSGAPPVDIYLCENAKEAASLLRKETFAHLREDERVWAEDNVGFVATSVACMVPSKEAFPELTDPLSVVADGYRKLPYDVRAARALPPPVKGMKPVENFQAEFFRKLHTHNLGHAALAYLGYIKGYVYVHEGFSDPFIGEVFEKALDETQEALFRRFPDLHREEHQEIRKDIRVRFGNPLLRDTVYRVGRDPLRKLAPSERLVGSAMLCLEEGIFPEHTACVCAAALRYDWDKDSEAVRLQEMLREKGLSSVLSELCGIAWESPLRERILSWYAFLQPLRKG